MLMAVMLIMLVEGMSMTQLGCDHNHDVMMVIFMILMSLMLEEDVSLALTYGWIVLMDAT